MKCIYSAIGVFIVLVSLKRVEASLFERVKIIKLEIQYKKRGDMVRKLEEYFKERNIKVQNIEFEIDEEEETE